MPDWEDRLIIIARVVTEAHQGLDGSCIVDRGRGGHSRSRRAAWANSMCVCMWPGVNIIRMQEGCRLSTFDQERSFS